MHEATGWHQTRYIHQTQGTATCATAPKKKSRLETYPLQSLVKGQVASLWHASSTCPPPV